MPEFRLRPWSRHVLRAVLLAQVLAIPALASGVLMPLVHRSAHELASAMQLATDHWHALAADPSARQRWVETLKQDHGIEVHEDPVATEAPGGLDVYAWALSHALSSGSVRVFEGPQGSQVQWVADATPGKRLTVIATPPRLRPVVLALLLLQLSGIAGTLLAMGWQRRLDMHQRRKAVLLGSLAHDLRTPLTRLRLLVDLQDDLPGADRAAMLGSVVALQALVDQSLDLFTAEPNSAVRTQGWREWVVARQADWPEVRWRGAESPAADRLLPNPEILTRALGNLLDNAHDHGQSPTSVAVEDDGRTVHLVVRDAGAGVPPKVWKYVCREEMPPARGHGIGLLSTRWLMERSGGALTWRQGEVGLRMPWFRTP